MLALMLLACLFAALVSFVAGRSLRRASGWLAALVPLLLFGLLWQQIPPVLMGATPVETYRWVEDLGGGLAFDLVLQLDALALSLALLVTGMGGLLAACAGFYLARNRSPGLFLLALLGSIGALLGLVLAGNLPTLLLFWHLALPSAYLLVGHRSEERHAQQSAMQVLIVGVGSGLALLAGLLLLGQAAQSVGVGPPAAYSFAGLQAAGASVANAPLAGPAVILVCLGCAGWLALVPLHGWRAGALAHAPAPAGAALVACISPGGLAVLARLHPILSGSPIWGYLLLLLGSAGLLGGAVLALRQRTIPMLLACSASSYAGLAVLLAGVGGDYAPLALLMTLLTLALSHGALLLLLGTVAQQTGTDDLQQLGQLFAALPITTWLATLAALSLAGLPLFLGFVARGLLFEAIFASPLPEPVRAALIPICLIGGALQMVVAWRLVYRTFFGTRPARTLRPLREAPAALLIVPGLLVSWALALGLPELGMPNALRVLCREAALVIAGNPAGLAGAVGPEVALLQGLGWPLIGSLVIMLPGLVLIYFEERMVGLLASMPGGQAAGGGAAPLVDGLQRGAASLTGLLERGHLRSYIAGAVMVWLGLVGPLFVAFAFGANGADLPPLALLLEDIRVHEALVILVVVGGAILTPGARSRREALIGVVGVGVGLALFFALLSAPDLALVQALVSAITVVLLLLAFAWLPRRCDWAAPRGGMLRDALVAGGAGLLVAGLTVAAAGDQSFASLAALPPEPGLVANPAAAPGSTRVAAILADHRALDLLGVLATLLAVLPATRGLLQRGLEHLERGPASGRGSLLLHMALPVLAPLLLVLSASFLPGGQAGPGMGLGGGLLAAATILLYVLVAGPAAVQRMLPVGYLTMTALGLLFAAVWGSLGLLASQPALAAVLPNQTVPGLGAIGTPLLFNLGAYVVVVGVATNVALLLAAAPATARPVPEPPESSAPSTPLPPPASDAHQPGPAANGARAAALTAGQAPPQDEQ